MKPEPSDGSGLSDSPRNWTRLDARFRLEGIWCNDSTGHVGVLCTDCNEFILSDESFSLQEVTAAMVAHVNTHHFDLADKLERKT